MKITGTEADSKCMYCGSSGYGVGCMYSPNKYHVHADDPKRCVYCGSPNFGTGCMYAPNKYHVHGIAYNTMLKDSIEKSFFLGYTMNLLSSPIEDIDAYKLKLIDENYNIVKYPENDEEKQALSPINVYLFKLKKIMGSKVNLVNNQMLFDYIIKDQDSQKDLINEDCIKKYENELKFKSKIQTNLDVLKEIFDDGVQSGLDTITLERILLESLLAKKV